MLTTLKRPSRMFDVVLMICLFPIITQYVTGGWAFIIVSTSVAGLRFMMFEERSFFHLTKRTSVAFYVIFVEMVTALFVSGFTVTIAFFIVSFLERFPPTENYIDVGIFWFCFVTLWIFFHISNCLKEK